MPRYTAITGPTAELLSQRLDPTVVVADRMRGALLGHALQIERARSLSLQRERDRVIDKYGPDSPQALRAVARVTAQVHAIDALDAERARSTIGPVRLDPNATIVHGLVDAAGSVASIVDAQGKSVAQATVDQAGYFRIAAPASAAPTTLVVTSAKGTELHREELTGSAAGEARYREVTTGGASVP